MTVGLDNGISPHPPTQRGGDEGDINEPELLICTVEEGRNDGNHPVFCSPRLLPIQYPDKPSSNLGSSISTENLERLNDFLGLRCVKLILVLLSTQMPVSPLFHTRLGVSNFVARKEIMGSLRTSKWKKRAYKRVVLDIVPASESAIYALVAPMVYNFTRL